MYDPQFIISLIFIGILTYAGILHGLVYSRLLSLRVDGVFSLLCFAVAAYASTNVIALFVVTDLSTYVITSKLSSVFVLFTIVCMAWFASEYLNDKTNIPLKLILIALTPFFILNLVMPNGILWSSIDGIELIPRSRGTRVTQPVNEVIGWSMYGLIIVIASIYLLVLRAAFLSFRKPNNKRGLFLFVGFIMLFVAFIVDALIDIGINTSDVYVSEYVVVILVMGMSIHLSDELRNYAQNLETMVSERTVELQKANKELQSFSHSISHDLQAPLRAMHGFANALQEDFKGSLNTEARDHIQRILGSTNRMQTMVDAMLNLSKVTRAEIEKRENNISQIAADIVNELKEQDSGRQVSFIADENVLIRGDPVLIRILLENLIGNAWKYTQKSKEPKISLQRHICSNGKNGFVITDNGVGFNGEYADRLFVMFQRLHSEKEFPGIGIGLATVANIVNRHNGKIWAEGREGEGASFYVCLE